jgi:flagellar basal body P-ring protein FlgI
MRRSRGHQRNAPDDYLGAEGTHFKTVAISHGALTIQVQSTPMVSQPLPFFRRETVTDPDERIDVTEEGGPLRILRGRRRDGWKTW